MGLAKILCPTDFSPGAQHAIRAAVRLAHEHGAALELVHVWSVPVTAFSSDDAYDPALVARREVDARAALAAAVGEAIAMGGERVTSRLLNGPAWHQIVDLAAGDPACGLIVIGSHGRTGLSRVFLGSVAELVVRHAPCPVLAIRGEHGDAPYHHVLCAVDFSASARAAVELAAQLVDPQGGRITLLHVFEPAAAAGEVSPFDLHGDLGPERTAALEGWAAELGARVPMAVAIRSRVGAPGAQILAMLDEDRSIDLVAMGSHGRTGLERLALGSVAEKTVCHARCPVLVTHADR
jgi:nucleotide-binding universal stress UspA family protein